MHRFAAALLFALLALPAPAAEDDRPLPVDPRNLTGRLENGVTWWFRKHQTPPGKLSVHVHVRAGSLNETDSQRGLAHFLEHMAFNGTEHFGPGTLVPYFESIGMVFGDGANAFTSLDRTVYMLTLPDVKPEGVEKALTILSDYVFRQSLLPAELEKERGVILEEMRMRKSPEERVNEAVRRRVFAGSRFADRMPIGTEEVLKTAERTEFEDFYRTWYRPELLTVILVGDAEAEAVVPLVSKWFGTYRAPVPERPAPGAGVTPFAAPRSIVLTDPELTTGEFGMTNVGPARPPVTTVGAWRRSLVEGLAFFIVNRRLSERVRRGEAAWQSATAGAYPMFAEATVASAGASGKPEDWNRVLDELIVEVNRAREFGFTKRELALAKAEQMAAAERAVTSEPTEDAQRIVFRLMGAVHDRRPVYSAEQELGLVKEHLGAIEVAEVSEAFRSLFAPDTFAYVLILPQKEGLRVPTEEELTAAVRAARALKYDPPREEEQAVSLLAAEPKAGEVAETKKDEASGVTSVWFANGVRMHHRFMDYRKDAVLVSVALAGGQIEEDAASAGVTQAAALAFSQPATDRLNSSQVADLMTGRNVSVSAEAEGDSLTVYVRGTRKDLGAGFELAHALLTGGVIEASVFRNYVTERVQELTLAARAPQARAVDALRTLVAGDDPRLMPDSPERVSRLLLPAAQAWLVRLCREAPVEVAVVGDLSFDEAVALVGKYVGSLPARPRTAEPLDARRKVARKPGPWSARVEVDTITPQGMVIFGFIGAASRAIDDARLLRLAGNILDTRVNKRVREELGLAYSAQALSQPAPAFEETGLVIAVAPCDPAKAEEVAKEIEAVFAAFAEKGPEAEELSNAKKQVLTDHAKRVLEPRYWHAVLAHHDLQRVNLPRVLTLAADYEGYTAEQVREAFVRHFRPDRTLRVVAVPAPVPAGAGGK